MLCTAPLASCEYPVDYGLKEPSGLFLFRMCPELETRLALLHVERQGFSFRTRMGDIDFFLLYHTRQDSYRGARVMEGPLADDST
jgi:hypothetical protein